MIRIAAVTLALIAAQGCKPPKSASDPAPAGPGSSAFAVPGAGPGVMGVRPAGQRLLSAADLKDLHLFLDSASGVSGTLPDKSALADIAKQAPKLGKAIEDGSYIIAWGGSREGVWAYDKDAPTKGGMVLTNQGVERFTAADLAQRLGR